MFDRHHLLTSALALAATLIAATAADAEIRPYIGASAGQTRVDLDLSEVDEAGFRIEDEDFAYKLFFGLELPGPLAVEAGYRDLGEVTDQTGLRSVSSQSDGIDAYLIGKLPLGPVALFAKGGVISWDTEVRTTANEGLGLPDIRIDDDGTDFAWGVGISAEIGRVGVRGEVERFELELPDDLTMLSVGVFFEF